MPTSNVNPRPGQEHVKLEDRFITAIVQSPEGQGLLNDIRQFVTGIVCRLKGSCAGRISEAVSKVGYAGYRRQIASDPRKWEMFLSNGQHLSWDITRSDNQKNWYLASGYWQKLKDAGLDLCCLKSTWPPSEAFPYAADGLPYDGVVRIDADGYLADFDRVNFSEEKLKSFSNYRLVGEYPAGTPIPPFGLSQTKIGGGVNSAQTGLNPIQLGLLWLGWKWVSDKV